MHARLYCTRKQRHTHPLTAWHAHTHTLAPLVTDTQMNKNISSISNVELAGSFTTSRPLLLTFLSHAPQLPSINTTTHTHSHTQPICPYGGRPPVDLDQDRLQGKSEQKEAGCREAPRSIDGSQLGARETDWEQVACAHLFLAPAVTSGLIQTQEAALSVCINLQARWNDGLRNSVKMSEKTKPREMWLIKEIPRPFMHRRATDMLHDLVPCKQHCYL